MGEISVKKLQKQAWNFRHFELISLIFFILIGLYMSALQCSIRNVMFLFYLLWPLFRLCSHAFGGMAISHVTWDHRCWAFSYRQSSYRSRTVSKIYRTCSKCSLRKDGCTNQGGQGIGGTTTLNKQKLERKNTFNARWKHENIDHFVIYNKITFNEFFTILYGVSNCWLTLKIKQICYSHVKVY